MECTDVQRKDKLKSQARKGKNEVIMPLYEEADLHITDTTLKVKKIKA
jgi:hypothetical protein